MNTPDFPAASEQPNQNAVSPSPARGSAAIVAAIEALNRHIEKGLSAYESYDARHDRNLLVKRLIELTQPPNNQAQPPAEL